MILITGATGLVGESLLYELYNKGIRKVRVLDYDGEVVGKELLANNINDFEIEKVKGDLRDYNSLLNALDGVQTVYSLAAFISIVEGEKIYKELYDVNVKGIENLINACHEKKVKEVLHVSSVEAIGDDKSGKVVVEEMGFRPECGLIPYGKTKALASNLILEKAKEFGIRLVIVCPGGILGPYDYKVSRVDKMVWDLTQGTLPGYIDGDFGYVDSRDVASLCVLALEKGQNYNSYIAVSQNWSMDKYVEYCCSLTGTKKPMKMPMPLINMVAFFSQIQYDLFGGQPLITKGSLNIIQSNLQFSSKKAIDLGWSPRSMEQTVSDIYQWYKKNFSKLKI